MGNFQEYDRQSHQEWTNESRHETSTRRTQVGHAEADEGCYYQ
jgi:hypothetical protein